MRKRKREPATCAFCGTDFMARTDLLAKGMGRFCTKSCQVKDQHKNGTNKAARSGEDHHNWNGGRMVDAKGYLRVYVPGYGCGYGNHPPEHRYVMEQHVGRKLTRNEHVHHIDGDVQNNALENLELMTASEHAKHHNLGGDTANHRSRNE